CWRRRLAAALILVLASLLSMVFVEVAKELVRRPRPQQVVGTWDPSRPSFAYPSGHAFNSTAVYVMVALLIGGRRGRMAVAVAVTVAVLVGLTRLYLGVHWLTDVLGGWAGGAGWALLWVWLERRLTGTPAQLSRAGASHFGTATDRR